MGAKTRDEIERSVKPDGDRFAVAVDFYRK